MTGPQSGADDGDAYTGVADTMLSSGYGEDHVAEMPIFAVPVDTFNGAAVKDVAATEEAARITKLLGQLGAVARPWERAVPTDLTAIDDRLADWAAGGGARTSALLWIGHGRSLGDRAELLVPARANNERDAGFVPQSLARHLDDEYGFREERHWALVMVEACGAAGFMDQVEGELRWLRHTTSGDFGALLIGSGENHGPGHLGTLYAELARVLAGYTDHDAEVRPADLASRLDGRQGLVVKQIGVGRSLPLRRRPVRPLPVTATVEDYQRLHRLLDASGDSALTHFLRKGVCSGPAELSWGFTGRTADRETVAAWLADTAAPDILAVTGDPGVGKSAFLGNLLMHAHPEIGSELETAGFGERLQQGLGLPPFDVVLHLAGADPHEVIARLITVFGAPDALAPGRSPESRLSALEPALSERGPVHVLADALDEADEPLLVADLLRELAQLPGVRLIVGTRPDAVPSAPGRTLLDALGEGTGQARAHRLTGDPAAARSYVAASLREFGDPEAVASVAVTAADRVSDGSWHFLQTALVVQEIEYRPELLTPDLRPDLDRLLTQDGRGLLDSALARITDAFPAAEHLLAALAHTHGRGVPRADHVWSTIAGAFAPDGAVPADTDITRLLDRAAAYVLLDGDERQTVHRLVHRTFADALRARSGADRRVAVVRALTELVEHRAELADSPANSYLARHLSGHAAAAGPAGWRELAASTRALDETALPDLGRDVLAARLTLPAGGSAEHLPPEVLGSLTAAPLIRAARPADRPGLRQLGALRTTGRLPQAGPGASWWVSWGLLRRHAPHLTLGGHTRPVRALASWNEGSDRFVSGAEDGSVMVWDPWFSHAPIAVVPGPPRAGLTALAALPPTDSGRGPLVAVAHGNRTVRVWDVSAGPQKVAEFDTPTFVTGMAVTKGGSGRLTLVGPQGYVAVVDLDEQVPRPRSAQRYGNPHTVVGVDARRVVTSTDTHLVLWDVTGERPRRVAKVPTADSQASLTLLPGAGQQARLAGADTAGGARQVTFWTLDGEDRLVHDDAPMATGAADLVTLAGIAGPGDTPRLLTTTRDGVLRLWDLTTRSSVTEIRADGPVGGARLATVAGPPGLAEAALPVTASSLDTRIRVWDPTPHEVTGLPLGTADGQGVTRMLAADGEELITVRWDDGTERTYAAADGTERRTGGARPAPLPPWDIDLPDNLGGPVRDRAALDRGRTAVAVADGVAVLETAPNERQA
ncbi:WD40 repeat [Streptomyces sp. PpalLS-921]|nr:WD40 repeat [Streptomyces sp. PpalLS-921]